MRRCKNSKVREEQRCCRELTNTDNLAELHETVLSHLDRAVLASAHSPYETLFDFYASITSRWITYLVAGEATFSQAELQTGMQAFVDLCSHVSTLTLTALVTTETANFATLHLLESTAIPMREALLSGSRAVPLIIPPPHTLYLLAMSSSLNDLDGVCSLLTVYKQAYESEVRVSGESFQSHVNRFNGYLMDLCNLLWRSQGLTSDENVLGGAKSRSKAKASALGCLCPPDVFEELQEYVRSVDRDYNIGSMLGLTHNPALGGMARSVAASLEEADEAAHGYTLPLYHAGPVTSNSLDVLRSQGGLEVSWLEFRAAILEWMEARGIAGIKELMWATMKKDLSEPAEMKLH